MKNIIWMLLILGFAGNGWGGDLSLSVTTQGSLPPQPTGYTHASPNPSPQTPEEQQREKDNNTPEVGAVRAYLAYDPAPGTLEKIEGLAKGPGDLLGDVSGLESSAAKEAKAELEKALEEKLQGHFGVASISEALKKTKELVEAAKNDPNNQTKKFLAEAALRSADRRIGDDENRLPSATTSGPSKDFLGKMRGQLTSLEKQLKSKEKADSVPAAPAATTSQSASTPKTLPATTSTMEGKRIYQLPHGGFVVADPEGRKTADGKPLVLYKTGESAPYQVFEASSIGLTVGDQGSLSISSTLPKSAMTDQGTTSFVPVVFGEDGKAHTRVLETKTGMTYRSGANGTTVSAPIGGGVVQTAAKLPSGVSQNGEGIIATNGTERSGVVLTSFDPRQPEEIVTDLFERLLNQPPAVQGTQKNLETFYGTARPAVEAAVLRTPASVEPVSAGSSAGPGDCVGGRCGAPTTSSKPRVVPATVEGTYPYPGSCSSGRCRR